MDSNASSEIPGERSSKRPREIPSNVGHYHDEDNAEHLMRVVLEPTIGTWQTPKAFVPWFENIHSTIIVVRC
jgi:hypothetical protein